MTDDGELRNVSLRDIKESLNNRLVRENVLAFAWVESMPLWAHRAIKERGNYHDLPHTYGYGGFCHFCSTEYERKLNEAGYKIVPMLEIK